MPVVAAPAGFCEVTVLAGGDQSWRTVHGQVVFAEIPGVGQHHPDPGRPTGSIAVTIGVPVVAVQGLRGVHRGGEHRFETALDQRRFDGPDRR